MEYSCIDTHVHFWKYNKQRDAWITDNMKILQQDYLPSTIESSLKRNGVDGVVAVQADQSEEETLFLKELSLTHGFIKGVVGWVDLQAENIEERLQYFSQFRSIKGFRHIAQGEPDDFLLGEKIQRGVKALKAFDYTYDILIYHNQLKAAVKFASKFHHQKFVLHHCAQPDIKNNKIELRSICRKNRWPKPLPSAAPSIIPGKSAMQKLFPSRYSTMPRLGVMVVNA